MKIKFEIFFFDKFRIEISKIKKESLLGKSRLWLSATDANDLARCVKFSELVICVPSCGVRRRRREGGKGTGKGGIRVGKGRRANRKGSG
jgi:hypothetical protein